MPENDRKPSLRFKGFNDAWEQCKLGEVCDVLTGGEAPNDFIKSMSAQGEYKYPIFSNGLGMNALWGFSKTYSVNVPAITFSSIGTLGYPELRNPYFTPIIRLKVIIPKDSSYDISFIKNALSLSDFSNNASGIPNINAKAVKDIELKISKNYDEQKMIGHLFNQVDNLITLHQRKYDKLVSVKKALLDKMFPENGNDVPKVRFKGFTDAWEQCELGELISKGGSGGTPTSTNPNYYNGNIPFLSITDISNSNGFIFRTEKYITEMGLNNSAAWIVPKESISLAMYASVGKVAILKENIATSQAFYNLVIDNLNTRDYVFHYLKKMEMNREWDSLISTGTQANLNAEKVKKLIIMVPANIDEQARLGTLFNHIDSLITLHQRKHEKLQNIKKALLSKMFA